MVEPSLTDPVQPTQLQASPTSALLTAATGYSPYYLTPHSALLQPDLLKKLGDPAQNIAMENHQFGVPPSHFDRWPVLKEDFVIISTTKDR